MQLLRFSELKARGIVGSWPQLNRMIESSDFPPGRLISARVRAWTEAEIEAWFEKRPTEPGPLQGVVKRLAEERAARAAAGVEKPKRKPSKRPPLTSARPQRKTRERLAQAAGRRQAR